MSRSAINLIRNPDSHLATYIRSISNEQALLSLVNRWQNAPGIPESEWNHQLNRIDHPHCRLWTPFADILSFGLHPNGTLYRLGAFYGCRRHQNDCKHLMHHEMIVESILWTLLDWNDVLHIQSLGWLWGSSGLTQHGVVLELNQMIADIADKRSTMRQIIVRGIEQRIRYLLCLEGKTIYMRFPDDFFAVLRKYREQPEALLSAPDEEWRLVGHHVT